MEVGEEEVEGEEEEEQAAKGILEEETDAGFTRRLPAEVFVDAVIIRGSTSERRRKSRE